MENNRNGISERDAAAVHLLEQSMGMTYQAALRAATVLGIADYLKVGARSANELGREVNVDGQKLYRIMRMLASRQIFEEVEGGVFH